MASAKDIVGMYFEDLEEGMSETMSRTVTEADIQQFADVTGDTNPVHLDEEYAQTTMFKGRIAHGMYGAGLLSAVFGTKMPGPGAVYVMQTLKFRGPVMLGDTLVAHVKVTGKDAAKKFVNFDTLCTVNDKPVIKGEAILMVPSKG